MKIIYSIAWFLIPLLSFSNNDWVKKESFGGGQRERTVSFSIGGRGYVGMGQDTANLMRRDLWEYDPGVDSWTQKAMCPGVARRNALSFVIGTSAYIGTGMDNADAWFGNPLSDMWEYNVLTNSWIQRASCPLGGGFGVYYSSGFAINGRGYAVCGKLGPSNYTNQCWEYNPATNSWLQKPSFPGSVRYGTSCFVINNQAYVGLGADENAFVADMWKFNPATNSWSSIGNFPASARFTCSAFTLFGKGYICLGTDGGYKDNLYEYEPSDNSWVERKNFEGEPRRNAACFVIGNRAYAGTGKGASGCKRDLWEYTPWAPLSTGADYTGDFPLKLFPNPMQEQSTLAFTIPEGDEAFRYMITDIAGKIIREETILNVNSLSIERGSMKPGQYFIRLFTVGGYSSTIPFIVK